MKLIVLGYVKDIQDETHYFQDLIGEELRLYEYISNDLILHIHKRIRKYF